MRSFFEISELWRQLLALLPIYILQFSYGMNSAYPAVTTPQLTMNCSSFSITLNQESWIGRYFVLSLYKKYYEKLFFLVSIDNLISPIICIISGSLQQRFGPRTILMINCLPIIFSWSLPVLAGVYKSIWLLYISR